MNNEQIKELCLNLMKTDSEEQVVEILKDAGLWDNPVNWRYYGDKENNYSAAGNQADEAESALVEKLTNSRDAILMSECMLKGIKPQSDNAPAGVKEAVAEFFEEDPKNELAGQIKEWSNVKRREVAKNISVYLTGPKPTKDKFPSINIADKGEGQTPARIPETILSLGESIKKKIRFVHGKWNMGGTAALIYCGKRNLQLIISKRNPKLLSDEVLNLIGAEKKERDDEWGFTIVRREDPFGKDTSSTYKYLAPVNSESNPNRGGVLSFSSQTMPIFAKFNQPYSVDSEWGTLIKLYEYETSYKQNVQGHGGLLRPLDLLAPDLGLPFRLHECRYEGTPASFEHQINGLRVRLHDNKGDVLEPGYPTFHNPSIEGDKISIAVYAFKDDKAKTYREADKGCIFVLNGQSQGWLDDRLFTRTKVGLGFIRNSLLVIVDCSELGYRGQEKLFVNDRVHIRKGTEFFNKIEAEIIDYLGHHQGLADLQEARKRKLAAEKLDDSKPLEAVLTNVFKHSDALSRIFLKGQKLSNPFRPDSVKAIEVAYEGKQYPTMFKFKKLSYGETLQRDAFIGKRCRIAFETDAANDYFNRKTNRGVYKLFRYDESGQLIEVPKEDLYGLSLYNGVATLNIDIADGKFQIGDNLNFLVSVTDPMRIIQPPFENKIKLIVKPEVQTQNEGGKKPRVNPPDKEKGNEREQPSGVQFPKIYKVHENEWASHEFDKYSGMRAVRSKILVNGEHVTEYTFYINMDNIYLQHEIKSDLKSKQEAEAYFEYGMALIGISLIYDDQQNSLNNEEENDIEERMFSFSRAMSPILIPMIKEFSSFKTELLEQLID